MHYRFALALLVASPALAAKKPPPPPPLPPLVLDAAAPIVTMTIDGQPLRLRVDPGVSYHVEINASAAQRLGLATPGRLVAGKPADLGRTTTQVGKVKSVATTSRDIMGYADRQIAATLAWTTGDPVAGADGQINPRQLPHDVVRLVRRPAGAGDVTTHLPMRWESSRGLLGTLAAGRDSVDVVIHPGTPVSVATAAAASVLAQGHGGRLVGPARPMVISHGVSRPVRDVVFARGVDVAGVRVTKVPARVFDWSGKTDIPDADLGPGEAVVKGNSGRQREWAKLVLGDDALRGCAEIAFTKLPLAIDLVCPGLR